MNVELDADELATVISANLKRPCYYCRYGEVDFGNGRTETCDTCKGRGIVLTWLGHVIMEFVREELGHADT